MNIGRPTHHFLDSIGFSFYESSQIHKISAKQITISTLFDQLNLPVKGGLYDGALGPFDRHDSCDTCGLNYFTCPGHFGHIELAVPVYNPLVFSYLLKILKNICTNCHHFKWDQNKMLIWKTKLKLLKLGMYFEAKEVDSYISAHESKSLTNILDLAKEKSDSVETQEDLSTQLSHYYHQCKAKYETQKASLEYKPVKSSLIENFKREIIGEWLASTGTASKCANCKSFVPKIFNGENTKLFEIPLSENQILRMRAIGLKKNELFEDEKDDDNSEEEDDDAEAKEVEDQDTNSIKTRKSSYKTEDEAYVPKLSLKEDKTKDYRYLTPVHIYEHFKKLWNNEQGFLDLIFCSKYGSKEIKSRPSIFFMETIPVPPTKFRPPSQMEDKVFENPQNEYLIGIIKANDTIMQLNEKTDVISESEGLSDTSSKSIASQKKENVFERRIKAWITMQEQVNSLFDSGKLMTGGRQAHPGIKQILEKKHGLFRNHMMGKRVNFAARSVISPDVNIETNEIGLPMVFATKLTYPEPVTKYNIHMLRQSVLNGPKTHPGATHVQMEDGTLVPLDRYPTPESRIPLANTLLTPSDPSSSRMGNNSNVHVNKRVWRHIQDGDILILNRQPTLHKPSMMAHKAKVLSNEKTIRMHYANCNTYNADFDGDEMNIHCPQSELARAEAYLIANTDRQYLAPTDGAPLRGLIQDHVVTGVLLSMRDCFLTRESYQQLLMLALPSVQKMIKTIPPAIQKPKKLWTGKQLLSSVLLNLTAGYAPLNLTSKTKIPSKLWGPYGSEEGMVRFVDSYLATGILDKSQFGTTAYGLAHSCYELYGPEVTGSLLTTLGKLFTGYLQMAGFTCRMDDLLLTSNADAARHAIIRDMEHVGKSVALSYVGLREGVSEKKLAAALEIVIRNDESLRGLDGSMKAKMNEVTSNIIDVCLPDGQYIPFPKNHMALMTTSGAKGSIVNASQISGALGQQELEGRRVPLMPSGKSLPTFPPFCTLAKAGGYIASRFLTGVQPYEYFFHCMAGREGLIDTAVKTSRSGYLQRCLVKHLEDLKVEYDGTVRSSDGSVVQFYYGEDGLDVIEQKHLLEFDFLAANTHGLKDKLQPQIVLDKLETELAYSKMKKTIRHKDKYDPVLASINPSVHLGATSESFFENLEAYIKSNPSGYIIPEDKHHSESSKKHKRKGTTSAAALNDLGIVSIRQFRALMWLRYMRGLVQPGEAVGVLAAQSIGEPSTQMTLNTFHFAGFGAKNVTLGIPRLREIIMTGSKNIKTPTTMTPFRDNIDLASANKILSKIGRLTFMMLTESLKVTEALKKFPQGRMHVYKISLRLVSLSVCRSFFGEDFVYSALVPFLQGVFMVKLMEALRKSMGTKSRKSKTSEAGPKISSNTVSAGTRSEAETGESELETDATLTDVAKSGPEDSSSSSASESEDDEDVEKTKKRTKEFATYDGSSIDDDDNVESEDESMSHHDRDDKEGYDHTSEDLPYLASVEEKKTAESQELIKGSTELFKISLNIKSWEFNTSSGLLEFELWYTAGHPKIFLLSLIEALLPKLVLIEIPKIKRAFVTEENITTIDGKLKKGLVLSTEGVNFNGLNEWYESLDLDKIYSNDIDEVIKTFGIEAGRSVIIKEIAAVFAVYGISVNLRHLSLIADYMTYDGQYKPMNRLFGIKSSTSPLSKMSFETTFQFLKDATIFSDMDPLQNPSARLVVGQVTKVGTGSVEIIQKI